MHVNHKISKSHDKISMSLFKGGNTNEVHLGHNPCLDFGCCLFVLIKLGLGLNACIGEPKD